MLDVMLGGLLVVMLGEMLGVMLGICLSVMKGVILTGRLVVTNSVIVCLILVVMLGVE